MVDPKKMAAWAGGQHGGMKPGKNEMPDGAHHEDDGEEHEDEQHAEEEEQEDSGEGHGALIAALEEFAEDVEDCCDELDGDALADPEAELSDEDMQILRDGLDALPEKLHDALREHAAGISHEDAMEIADHLEEEEKITDPGRVAGWLYHAGQTF